MASPIVVRFDTRTVGWGDRRRVVVGCTAGGPRERIVAIELRSTGDTVSLPDEWRRQP
jgi:hypothetical protein